MKYLIFCTFLSLNLGLSGAEFPGPLRIPNPQFKFWNEEPNDPIQRREDVRELLRYAPVFFKNKLDVSITVYTDTNTDRQIGLKEIIGIDTGRTKKLGVRSGILPLSDKFDVTINDWWLRPWKQSKLQGDIASMLIKYGVINNEEARIANLGLTRRQLAQQYHTNCYILITLKKDSQGNYEMEADFKFNRKELEQEISGKFITEIW